MYGTSFLRHKQVKLLSLKYADATRVAALLQPLKSDQGTIVADQVTASLILIDTPEKLAEMSAVVEKADIATISRHHATETKTFRVAVCPARGDSA